MNFARLQILTPSLTNCANCKHKPKHRDEPLAQERGQLSQDHVTECTLSQKVKSPHWSVAQHCLLCLCNKTFRAISSRGSRLRSHKSSLHSDRDSRISTLRCHVYNGFLGIESNRQRSQMTTPHICLENHLFTTVWRCYICVAPKSRLGTTRSTQLLDRKLLQKKTHQNRCRQSACWPCPTCGWPFLPSFLWAVLPSVPTLALLCSWELLHMGCCT